MTGAIDVVCSTLRSASYDILANMITVEQRSRNIFATQIHQDLSTHVWVAFVFERVPKENRTS